ncbi:axoneme-associated protein mst101(2) [Drosophila teissieri]|uniref:axoneme-associated protein mst101(2) n=1 Tax=Drosophila teissieri TaxID=7243 RepID=UPI001CBA2188|nr:axoneme-associated protein mst101(2) [Drosophila teissieri]
MLKRASLALSHYPDACFRVCSCSTCLRMYHVVKCKEDLNVVQKSNQDYRRSPKDLQSVLTCQEGICDILSHRPDQSLQSAFLKDLEKHLNQKILRKEYLGREMTSLKREIFCETASSADGCGEEKCGTGSSRGMKKKKCGKGGGKKGDDGEDDMEKLKKRCKEFQSEKKLEKCREKVAMKKCKKMAKAKKCQKKDKIEQCMKCVKKERGDEDEECEVEKKCPDEEEELEKLNKEIQKLADQMNCEKLAKIEAIKQACREEKEREECARLAEESRRRAEEERKRAEEEARRMAEEEAKKGPEEDLCEIKRQCAQLAKEARKKAKAKQKKLKALAAKARAKKMKEQCKKIAAIQKCRKQAKKDQADKEKAECEKAAKEEADRLKALQVAEQARKRAESADNAKKAMCQKINEQQKPKDVDVCAKYKFKEAVQVKKELSKSAQVADVKENIKREVKKEIAKTPPPPPPQPPKAANPSPTPPPPSPPKPKHNSKPNPDGLFQICKKIAEKKLRQRKMKIKVLKAKCKKIALKEQCKCEKKAKKAKELDEYCKKKK